MSTSSIQITSLIGIIQIKLRNEYSSDITAKIMEIIEEDGFDDETIWDDVQDEDDSCLKEKMKLNQFRSLVKICEKYHASSLMLNPTLVVIYFPPGLCFTESEDSTRKTTNT